MEQYEIQDSNGTIHSFIDKMEADTAWDAMITTDEEMEIKYSSSWHNLKLKWQCSWSGDLKLVQLHRIHR